MQWYHKHLSHIAGNNWKRLQKIYFFPELFYFIMPKINQKRAGSIKQLCQIRNIKIKVGKIVSFLISNEYLKILKTCRRKFLLFITVLRNVSRYSDISDDISTSKQTYFTTERNENFFCYFYARIFRNMPFWKNHGRIW